MATLSNSTSVRLPNNVMDILKNQAKEEHRSVSNYIRMILTEFVKHKRQEPNATTRAAIDEARSDSIVANHVIIGHTGLYAKEETRSKGLKI